MTLISLSKKCGDWINRSFELLLCKKIGKKKIIGKLKHEIEIKPLENIERYFFDVNFQ